MPTHSPWFEMPSPFDTEVGKVLMLEPPWASRELLRAQLLDESYPKPFVIDDGEQRHLFFNLRLTQSVMRLSAPNELAVRYTQAMMSFLLFNPRPKRIVLIGLGGGSLLKFCFHRLPSAGLTAVELDPHVIALREAFLMPPDGPRLQILHGDGAMIFYRTGQSWFPRKLDSLEPGKLVLFICNSKPGAPSQSLPGRQPHPPLPRKNGSKKSFPSQAENWKMSCLVCLD